MHHPGSFHIVVSVMYSEAEDAKICFAVFMHRDIWIHRLRHIISPVGLTFCNETVNGT